MKVLVNTSPLLFQKAGIGYCIQNLVEQLQDKDLALVLSHDPEGARTVTAINSVAGNLKKVMGSFYPRSVAAFTYNLLVDRFCKFSNVKEGGKESFDIYHEMSHVLLPDIFRKTHIRSFIADIHDLSPVLYPDLHMSSLVTSVENSLKKLLDADLFITKSSFIKNEFANHFDIPKDKIKVVPNASSYPFRYFGKSREAVRAEICSKLPEFPDRPFLLYTGTIEPRKNLETLIRAFAQFRQRDDFTLVLAGGFGWKFESIKKLPRELGIDDQVHFLGYQPFEVFELLYNAADVFVYPSLYEGFGMPNIEAMMCGTPVITSNASCLPEVVGDAALLFDPQRPDELANCIERLIDSSELYEDLQRKGFLRAAEYSWESIGEQTYQIYRSVAS